MADPLTPRLPGQPPPLPPSWPPRPEPHPERGEPFPPDEKAPDTVRLGFPAARATTMLPPPPDLLTESTAALLRQELALTREVVREATPTQPALPISLAPLSRSQAVGKATVAVGKWSAIAMGLLGFAATVAHQFRPDLEGPLQFLIKLLGGQP